MPPASLAERFGLTFADADAPVLAPVVPVEAPRTSNASQRSRSTGGVANAAPRHAVLEELERRPPTIPQEDPLPVGGGDLGTPDPIVPPDRARAVLVAAASRPFQDGELDAERVASVLASGELLRAVPRRVVWSMRHGVQVLLDRGPGMLPFQHDQDQLVERLRALGATMEVATFEGCPGRGVFAAGGGQWRALGGAILLVTDLGIGRPPGHERAGRAEWRAFASSLDSRGLQAVALVPYPRARWPALGRGVAPVYWAAATTASEVRRRVREGWSRQGTERAGDGERLARALQTAGRGDWGLVRALRVALSAGGPEVEGDLAFGPHVRAAGVDGVDVRRGLAPLEDPGVRQTIHRRHLGASAPLRALEAAMSGEDTATHLARLAATAAKGDRWFRRWADAGYAALPAAVREGEAWALAGRLATDTPLTLHVRWRQGAVALADFGGNPPAGWLPLPVTAARVVEVVSGHGVWGERRVVTVPKGGCAQVATRADRVVLGVPTGARHALAWADGWAQVPPIRYWADGPIDELEGMAFEPDAARADVAVVAEGSDGPAILPWVVRRSGTLARDVRLATDPGIRGRPGAVEADEARVTDQVEAVLREVRRRATVQQLVESVVVSPLRLSFGVGLVTGVVALTGADAWTRSMVLRALARRPEVEAAYLWSPGEDEREGRRSLARQLFGDERALSSERPATIVAIDLAFESERAVSPAWWEALETLAARHAVVIAGWGIPGHEAAGGDRVSVGRAGAREVAVRPLDPYAALARQVTAGLTGEAAKDRRWVRAALLAAGCPILLDRLPMGDARSLAGVIDDLAVRSGPRGEKVAMHLRFRSIAAGRDKAAREEAHDAWLASLAAWPPPEGADEFQRDYAARFRIHHLKGAGRHPGLVRWELDFLVAACAALGPEELAAQLDDREVAPVLLGHAALLATDPEALPALLGAEGLRLVAGEVGRELPPRPEAAVADGEGGVVYAGGVVRGVGGVRVEERLTAVSVQDGWLVGVSQEELGGRALAVRYLPSGGREETPFPSQFGVTHLVWNDRGMAWAERQEGRIARVHGPLGSFTVETTVTALDLAHRHPVVGSDLGVVHRSGTGGIRHPAAITALAAGPHAVAAGSAGGAVSIDDAFVLPPGAGPVHALAWNADGSVLAGATATGAFGRRSDGGFAWREDRPATGIAWIDEHRCAVAFADGAVELRGAQTALVHRHVGRCGGVAWTGRHLTTWGEDGEVCAIADPGSTSAQRFHHHLPGWRPHTLLDDGELRPDRLAEFTVSPEHGAPVWSISGPGPSNVTGAADGSLYAWTWERPHRKLMVLRRHAAPITGLAWIDDALLVAVDLSGLVRVHLPATGGCAGAVQTHTPLFGVRVEGRELRVATGHGTVLRLALAARPHAS